MESQLIIPIITGITAALVGLGLGKLIFSKNSAAKVEEARKQAIIDLNNGDYSSAGRNVNLLPSIPKNQAYNNAENYFTSSGGDGVLPLLDRRDRDTLPPLD